MDDRGGKVVPLNFCVVYEDEADDPSNDLETNLLAEER